MQQGDGRYSVNSGDTMSGIAQQHGMSLEQLSRANPQVVDPDRIGVGDVLRIPPSHRRDGFEGTTPNTAAATIEGPSSRSGGSIPVADPTLAGQMAAARSLANTGAPAPLSGEGATASPSATPVTQEQQDRAVRGAQSQVERATHTEDMLTGIVTGEDNTFVGRVFDRVLTSNADRMIDARSQVANARGHLAAEANRAEPDVGRLGVLGRNLDAAIQNANDLVLGDRNQGLSNAETSARVVRDVSFATAGALTGPAVAAAGLTGASAAAVTAGVGALTNGVTSASEGGSAAAIVHSAGWGAIGGLAPGGSTPLAERATFAVGTAVGQAMTGYSLGYEEARIANGGNPPTEQQLGALRRDAMLGIAQSAAFTGMNADLELSGALAGPYQDAMEATISGAQSLFGSAISAHTASMNATENSGSS
jgi:LysM repeat protein